MRIHPYAIITALMLVVGTFYVMRHPLFALLVGFMGLVVTDLALKAKDNNSDNEK